MSIWTSHPDRLPISAAYASYFLNYMCLGTAPLIMSWLSDLIPQDPEARSLIVGVAIATYYAIGAWSQVLVWPAVQAPYYKFGWQSALAIWVLCIAMTVVLRYVDVRWMRPKREAFAEGIERGEISVAGQVATDGVDVDGGSEDGVADGKKVRGEDEDSVGQERKKGAEVAVKDI
jgi:MFS family permease